MHSGFSVSGPSTTLRHQICGDRDSRNPQEQGGQAIGSTVSAARLWDARPLHHHHHHHQQREVCANQPTAPPGTEQTSRVPEAALFFTCFPSTSLLARKWCEFLQGEDLLKRHRPIDVCVSAGTGPGTQSLSCWVQAGLSHRMPGPQATTAPSLESRRAGKGVCAKGREALLLSLKSSLAYPSSCPCPHPQ